MPQINEACFREKLTEQGRAGSGTYRLYWNLSGKGSKHPSASSQNTNHIRGVHSTPAQAATQEAVVQGRERCLQAWLASKHAVCQHIPALTAALIYLNLTPTALEGTRYAFYVSHESLQFPSPLCLGPNNRLVRRLNVPFSLFFVLLHLSFPLRHIITSRYAGQVHIWATANAGPTQHDHANALGCRSL